MSMVTGSLQEKKGYWYTVLNLKDKNGKSKPVWRSTGLKVKGNKTQANELLRERCQHWTEILKGTKSANGGNQLYADYIISWYDRCFAQNEIEQLTYHNAIPVIHNIIAPYFKERNITVAAMTRQDILDFYSYLRETRGVSQHTVKHYHTYIRKSYQDIVDHDELCKQYGIELNPAARIKFKKTYTFKGDFWSVEEANEAIKAAVGTVLEIPIIMGVFYGLRRGEILGLKWSAVDFKENTISIERSIVQYMLNGKYTVVPKESVKTDGSYRILPLVPEVKEILLRKKEQERENKKLFGKSYNMDWDGYINVHPLGDIVKPNYLTQHFELFQNSNGLRRIRFHDLRHTCASIMVNSNVPMLQLAEWMGHTDISTTAIYAHLDLGSKKRSAEVMRNTGITLTDV